MGRFRYTHTRVIGDQRHVWNVERLWELAAELPVIEIAVADISELEQDCWFSDTPPTVRAVTEHCRRIMQADLRTPIILSADGALMDGGHRVARALLEGVDKLPAVRFATAPPPDVVEPDV